MLEYSAMAKTAQKINGSHFYKFFQCPHWIWYDIYEDAKKHKHIPPIIQMLYEGRVHDEKNLLLNKKFEEVKPEFYKDLDEAFLATLELMKQGKNIYHGVLMDGEWVGNPDFLEARPVYELNLGSNVKSKFGDHYYVAYDIRNYLQLQDQFKFPLVFYSLILERIQGLMPKEAYLIDPDGNAKSFLIEPFLEDFHLNRKEIEKILNGEKPAPFLKSGCKSSPWFSICLDETKGCEDVSLVHSLSQSDQRHLYGVGIKTVQDLAEADLEKLRHFFEEWQFDKILRLQNQAQVLIKGEPMILKKPEFPEVETEVYFDVESDPTRGYDYLFGILVKEKPSSAKASEGKDEFKSFIANNKEEEEGAFREFLSYISKLENYVIYHYGYYEKSVIYRLQKKYNISQDELKPLRENSIDLHNMVNESVVLPLYFYSLKDVAKYIGFDWSADDAGGAESVVWYDEYLKSGDKKILNKILKYNEDDCRATMVVKEWLSGVKPTLKEKEKLPE